MGHIEHGVVEDVPDDRPLTDNEKESLAKGVVPKSLHKGNGSRPSFADLPPETVREYQRRSLETRRHNAAAKKLAEQIAYFEAHREHNATIMGAKIAMIEGLLEEMIDPETKKVDTRRMNEKRMTLLQQMLRDWEKVAGTAAPKEKDAQEVNVNVTHTVSRLMDALGDGS